MKEEFVYRNNDVPKMSSEFGVNVQWSKTIEWGSRDVEEAYMEKNPDQLFYFLADVLLRELVN